MGFLHEGHLSLVELARGDAARVAVSIFVNPLQFGPAEDFGRYPRDEERDLAMLEARGTALVFLPSVHDMYPDGPPAVTVSPGAMAERLCGAFRPGHFEGVLTVVAKLFGLVRPDAAVFGSKDYQQVVLIARMVRDLELGVEVRRAPTVREHDGLAMSSRNAYLAPAERAQAVGLHLALQGARSRFAAGERSAAKLRSGVEADLRAFPLLSPQYVEFVSPDSLEGRDQVSEDTVLMLAAFCGRTRLIDNTVLA